MLHQPMSRSEWQVMRVVWSQPNCTSQAIISALHERYAWQAATIKTLIGRLVKKNYLIADTSQRPFHYQAAISEDKHLESEWSHLLNNICHKKHGHLLYQMMQQADLSQQDCTKLIEWLQTKQTTAPTTIPCQCISGQCTCHQY